MNDGESAVGQLTYWDLLGSPATFIGFHNGEPVIQFNAPIGNYYFLPNTSGLSTGDALSVRQSEGPLVYCFARSSLIASWQGETAVEDLKIGDSIRTVSGEVTPVKWIGRQSF